MWSRNADEMFNRVHFSARSHFLGKEAAEEAGTRADVGHGHPRLQSQRPGDLMALDEHFAIIRLEPLDEPFDVGLLEGCVDSRIHLSFPRGLRPCSSRRRRRLSLSPGRRCDNEQEP